MSELMLRGVVEGAALVLADPERAWGRYRVGCGSAYRGYLRRRASGVCATRPHYDATVRAHACRLAPRVRPGVTSAAASWRRRILAR